LFAVCVFIKHLDAYIMKEITDELIKWTQEDTRQQNVNKLQ